MLIDVNSNLLAASDDTRFPDHRHLYGATMTISTGRVVPIRLIGEQHIREDLGRIPTMIDWARCIRPEPWMGRAQKLEMEWTPSRLRNTGYKARSYFKEPGRCQVLCV